ncbi:HNH endonuclease signature motif containing protein [Streptomyces sp. NPDC059175]|uniref:HNH endonuclease signature motif containing protein n=1 Tax=Streptomyces sp. NPDC059175 TaxID=3346757 RepID=UPI0036C61AA5
MADHFPGLDVPANPLCLDCGEPPAPPRARLTRHRCGRCYFRHLRAVKAAARPPRTLRPLRERLLEKTTPGWGGCVIWTAGLNGGYGVICVGDAPRRAHRVAYELFVGPIPQGLQLDHLCHTRDIGCPGGECIHRRCINPHHLEPVTNQENARRSPHTLVGSNVRKTHCPQGHPYSGENLRLGARGMRYCRACSMASWELWQACQPRGTSGDSDPDPNEALRRVRATRPGGAR